MDADHHRRGSAATCPFAALRDCDHTMTSLLVLCFLALQAAFIWARYAIFRIDGPAPAAVRFIEASATACIVAGTWLMWQRTDSSMAQDLLALALAACSAATFTWAARSIRPRQLTAAFSSDAPTELLQRGAFGVVRNPFYLAYMLAFAVPAVATWSWLSLMPAAWMAGIYLRAVMLEEHKFLAGPLAGEYSRYCARTGRFLPHIRGLTHVIGARHGR